VSDAWDRYTTLLAEQAGLVDHEVRSVATAEAAFAAEARRLQSTLQSAERERADHRATNSRVQVAVRDLVRSVGASVPVESALAPLAASEIGPALRSVEYDVAELRRSVEHVKAQKQALAQPATVVPRPAPTGPASDVPASPGARGGRTAVLAVLAVLVVLIVLAVALL
jgi:hypothetical protein